MQRAQLVCFDSRLGSLLDSVSMILVVFVFGVQTAMWVALSKEHRRRKSDVILAGHLRAKVQKKTNHPNDNETKKNLLFILNHDRAPCIPSCLCVVKHRKNSK